MPRKPSRLLSLLPGVHWAPSDIQSPDLPTADDKPKSRVTFFVRAHPSSSSSTTPDHGTLRPRKSTLDFTSEPDAARIHAQGQSDFFVKLPLELRIAVYEYVVGTEVVHLTLGAKKRYGHFICEDRRDNEEQSVQSVKECSCKVLVGRKQSQRLDIAALGMLSVCRRMYQEASPTLYTPHTISLLHPTHLLFLPTRLPTRHLSQIRTLRLRWAIRALPYLRRGANARLAYREDTANWERGWAIIASMQALRDLYVVLSDPSPQGMWERSWLELEGQLLEPVKSVVAPGRAEVVLPYARCGVHWGLGESRVVLRRPVGEILGEVG